jgi:hypothetical protein
MENAQATFSQIVWDLREAAVLEQPSKSFSAEERSWLPSMSFAVARKQENVALALMIPLSMKVLHELAQRAPQ